MTGGSTGTTNPRQTGGVPLGAWAPKQKKRLVARTPGAHVPIIFCMSRDKPRWSGPGRVRVDDRASARGGWERKGGAFVHHTSAERSIAAPRRLGFTGERLSAPTSDRDDGWAAHLEDRVGEECRASLGVPHLTAYAARTA